MCCENSNRRKVDLLAGLLASIAVLLLHPRYQYFGSKKIRRVKSLQVPYSRA